MYLIIRLIICIVLFAAIAITSILLKRRVIRAKTAVPILLIAFALSLVSSLVPFENLFTSFKTPEEVFAYGNLGEKSVDFVLEGEDSAFVYGKAGGKDTFMITPRENGEYKMFSLFSLKNYFAASGDDYTVIVYNYKGSMDYYIRITDNSDVGLICSDSLNSEFHRISYENGLFKFIYCCVSNPDNDYFLTIGNDRITRDELIK